MKKIPAAILIVLLFVFINWRFWQEGRGLGREYARDLIALNLLVATAIGVALAGGEGIEEAYREERHRLKPNDPQPRDSGTPVKAEN